MASCLESWQSAKKDSCPIFSNAIWVSGLGGSSNNNTTLGGKGEVEDLWVFIGTQLDVHEGVGAE